MTLSPGSPQTPIDNAPIEVTPTEPATVDLDEAMSLPAPDSVDALPESLDPQVAPGVNGDERLQPDVPAEGGSMDFMIGDDFDITTLEGPSPLGGPVNLSIEGEGIGSSLDPQALDLDFGAGQLVTEGDAEAQYRAGYDAVVQGDYAFAEAQFGQFVALFPDHPLAPDATNWLGEALLQRGEYDLAAQVLFGGFQRYEASIRAPDLLLKLGIALAGADERETACRTFAEVLKRYPGNGAAFEARVAQEQEAAQC